jgi:hypothetical protein
MASHRRFAPWLDAALALGVVLSLAWWWRTASHDAMPSIAETTASPAAANAQSVEGLRIDLLPDGGVSADPRSVRIGIANVSPDDLAAYRAWLRSGREGAGPGELADLAQVVRWIDVVATTQVDGRVVAGPFALPPADRYVLQARADDGLRFWEARFGRDDMPAQLRPRVAAGLRVRAPRMPGVRAGLLLRRVEGAAREADWQPLMRREQPALLDAYDDTPLPIDAATATTAIAPLPPGEIDVVAVVDGVESERRRVRLLAGGYVDFEIDPAAAELGAALSTTLRLRLVERGSGAPVTVPTLVWAGPRGERRLRPDARGVVVVDGIDASTPSSLQLQLLFPLPSTPSFLVDALPTWPERLPLDVSLGDAQTAIVEKTIELQPLRWLMVDTPGIDVPRRPRAASPFPVFVLQRREGAAWRDASADAFRPFAGGMAVSLDRDGPVRVAALLAPWRMATSPAVEVRRDTARYRTRLEDAGGHRVVLRLTADGQPLRSAPVAVLAALRGVPPLTLTSDGDGRLVLDGANVPSVRVEVPGFAQAEVRLDRAEAAVALVRDGG